METLPPLASDRLLTFEIGGTVYAVPIADVSEVTDLSRVASIPTVPRSIGGVMNHHGDALPVLSREVLLDIHQTVLAEPEHLLVLTQGPEETQRLGLPVERILGLVEGRGATARGDDAVAERRPMDGRVVSVIDTRKLMLNAMEVIERSIIGTDSNHGGES